MKPVLGCSWDGYHLSLHRDFHGTRCLEPHGVQDTGSPGNWSIRVPRKYQEHAHLGPKGGHEDVGRMLKIVFGV